jgi:XTP/dITP diphosphohydrolase
MTLRPEESLRPLVIATGNKGKVLEFQTLLAPAGFTLLTPKDIGFTAEVEETGDTFVKNALIKAQALAAHSSHPVLADDSGLEVDALGGAPGVYSARYAEAATDASGIPVPQDVANRSKLMLAMAGKTDRAARFRCVLCHLVPGREPAFFAGVCEGRIAEAERGEGGFGYDPVFIPEGFDRTFGELSHAVKDGMSHRGLAVARFLQSLALE